MLNFALKAFNVSKINSIHFGETGRRATPTTTKMKELHHFVFGCSYTNHGHRRLKFIKSPFALFHLTMKRPTGVSIHNEPVCKLSSSWFFFFFFFFFIRLAESRWHLVMLFLAKKICLIKKIKANNQNGKKNDLNNKKKRTNQPTK